MEEVTVAIRIKLLLKLKICKVFILSWFSKGRSKEYYKGLLNDIEKNQKKYIKVISNR